MNVAETRNFLTEKEFQAMIVARARVLGWLVHHDRGDYRQCIAGDPGFPDLVLARDGTVIFAELKSQKGRLTTDQVDWIDALSTDVSGVYTWRPEDWPHIQELLK